MTTQNNPIILILLILSTLIFTACPYGNGYKYNTGVFPEEVINFEEINTQFDDYNSTAPFIREVFPLCFSSNRNSNGGQFDIVHKLILIDFDKETAELNIYNETNHNLGVVEDTKSIFELVNKVNTVYNEFGPNILSMRFNESFQKQYSDIYEYSDSLYQQYLFLLATEKNGNLDIEFIHNFEGEIMVEPLLVNSINTEYNEAYPCFNENFSKLIYCSNEKGKFDIYEVPFSNEIKIQEALIDTINKNKTLLAPISSEGDDKSPFIEQNIMVFASNRAGGFGGYDLYYSKYENEKWGIPINMGERINTKYDEFRPILKFSYEFENDFLMFSSNRIGGKGGFDLYYTGVNLIK